MSGMPPLGLKPDSRPEPLSSAAGSRLADAEREGLRQAAEQFEAIFLRRMLKSARATNFDSEGLMGGKGIETFSTMRDEQFAELAAKRGGLGVAQMLEAQLSALVPGAAASSDRANLAAPPQRKPAAPAPIVLASAAKTTPSSGGDE